MTGESSDELYTIAWVDFDRPRPDGGVADPLVETRERLVRVEASQEKMRSSVERIEEKVDETHELVQEVDDAALSKNRFEREYEDAIVRGRKYITVGKWLGFALLAVTALVEMLGVLGYSPLAP